MNVVGYLCCPHLYQYAGWLFEVHSYCGPWPCKRNGELRARAGRVFYAVYERFAALDEAERETYRVGGGCVKVHGGNRSEVGEIA